MDGSLLGPTKNSAQLSLAEFWLWWFVVNQLLLIGLASIGLPV